MDAEPAPERGDLATMEAGIAAYLAACDVDGKSPRTVQAYRETLHGFQRICVADGLPDHVAAFRPADVYRFMKTIADAGVSLGTRYRRFRETRAFFSLCTRMGYCEPHDSPPSAESAEGRSSRRPGRSAALCRHHVGLRENRVARGGGAASHA